MAAACLTSVADGQDDEITFPLEVRRGESGTRSANTRKILHAGYEIGGSAKCFFKIFGRADCDLSTEPACRDINKHAVADATDVHRAWEQRKLSMQAPSQSILDGLPDSLPSLLTAYRMTQKVAALGFDWGKPADVLGKLRAQLELVRAR